MHKVRNFRFERRRSLLYATAICVLAPAGVQAQHVHGVVELGVVVEGGTVAVSLDAPLSDVVGFEHAPENDEQLELVRRAAATLSNPDAMFGLADSASCTISDTSIDGPAYVLEHLGDDAAGTVLSDHDATHDSHDTDHDHDEHEEAGDHDHDEHAEAGDHDHDEHDESAAHDHDEHEEADEHDHDDAEQHAEVIANYEWECANASDLDSLALRFTENFAGVETIEIQILTSAGAQVLTLEGRATSVSLSRP
ncbi:MAG: DUF2796 domain-containing protein [Gammaproteobacteria bacterium]|nr:DUF2796 domain-containing protein [Gammaproteobacteria bacterium]